MTKSKPDINTSKETNQYQRVYNDKLEQLIKELQYFLIKIVLSLQYYYFFQLSIINNPQMKNQILQIFDTILTAPLISQISRLDQEKLLNLTKMSKQRKFFFKLIQQSLNKSQEVIIRLKLLCLLQNLISHQQLEENLELINSIITAHQKRVMIKCQKCKDMGDMSNYLQAKVQLPFIMFLRKIIFWQDHDITSMNTDINVGFSLLNKLKQILQLKKIFHNYGCYYPSHKYAINMFKSTFFIAKKLWTQICFMVKDVTLLALRTNVILQEEFLFISSAEEIQQSLAQFVYGGYFSRNLGKDQKIKIIQLLKPQISQLQQERKKKLIEENIMECLKSKRQSRKQGVKNYLKKTGDSQTIEQRLTTKMEVQILDSILRLQSLINQ